jgi:hypothetical protein
VCPATSPTQGRAAAMTAVEQGSRRTQGGPGSHVAPGVAAHVCAGERGDSRKGIGAVAVESDAGPTRPRRPCEELRSSTVLPSRGS